MAVAPSLLTSSGSNCTRRRCAWLRWGSAGLRGSSSQQSVPTLRAWAPNVRGGAGCVRAGARAHGRGAGFSPDTVSDARPQRAAEKDRERGSGVSLLLFTLRRRTAERLVTRCVNELVFGIRGLENMLLVATKPRGHHGSFGLPVNKVAPRERRPLFQASGF